MPDTALACMCGGICAPAWIRCTDFASEVTAPRRLCIEDDHSCAMIGGIRVASADTGLMNPRAYVYRVALIRRQISSGKAGAASRLARGSNVRHPSQRLAKMRYRLLDMVRQHRQCIGRPGQPRLRPRSPGTGAGRPVGPRRPRGARQAHGARCPAWSWRGQARCPEPCAWPRRDDPVVLIVRTAPQARSLRAYVPFLGKGGSGGVTAAPLSA